MMIKTLSEGKQDFTMIGYVKKRDDIKVTNAGKLNAKIYLCTDYPEYMDISNLPDGYMSMNITNNHHMGYFDSSERSDDERIDGAYEYLKDKWIITIPYFTYHEDRDTIFVSAFDVATVKRNSGVNPDDMKFIRVPIFEKSIGYNRPQNESEFENALVSGKNVGDILPWPRANSEVPQGIIWKQSMQMNLYVNIDRQEEGRGGFSFYPEDKGGLRKVKILENSEIDDEWFRNLCISHNNHYKSNVIYVPIDIFNKYEKRATEFNIAESVYEADNKQMNIARDVTESHLKINYKQQKFIESFVHQTKQLGLHYDIKDLINFHTAMESRGLVILSGLSGTGKSKLVTAYAQSLGIVGRESGSNRLCFVPVRPFWADDSDLLGYADMVNNVYRPGDSGLIETLIEASNNPKNLYIVVFDEMNLARVEHYFSQFLSVLEMSTESRYIQLYNSQLSNRLYNSETYPDRIKIGDNILFVGTVNTDESTFQFSDKVLDRSNVISLHMVPFTDVLTPDTNDDIDESMDLSNDEYRGLVDRNQSVSLSLKEKSFLWEIHSVLSKNDRNLGIGWRIVQQIDNFLSCLPNIENGVSRKEAFDLQLVQRVLTKVRGSEEQLKELLEDEDDNKGTLIKILDEHMDISDFVESRAIIKQKARELKLYGFTM